MCSGRFLRGAVVSALAILAVLAASFAPAHAADDFPNRPIRLIVGVAAGGGNDLFARVVADKASAILGQAVVVENRPGAGGRLSGEYVSNQAADGYTLLVGASGAMSIAAAIYPDLKYHPTKTLVPLAMIASFPLIMVISKDNPANNVKEFVEWAKQHPDKMNYPATSPAFILPSEQLKLKSGMPGVMIPYKSSNEMILSVMEGQTAFAIADGPPTVPQVKADKVKALAVTGSTRSAELPDTPSMAEEGYPDVDIHLWSGIFAPIATPAPIVAKLEKAFNEAIRDPGVSAKLKNMAVDPGGGSPDEFKRMIDADIVKYVAIIKAANLHFEE
ncbi:MAG: tripartite tricarboxylate transporter substrate binding protein [Xanthobacteraceae bacterium]